MSIIQPTKVTLDKCTVNGINYLQVNNNAISVNFHVKELRIFEDICKFYFTGQLVIETLQNAHEHLLGPTVPVEITFEALRSDGRPSKKYSQRFRIHSYESTPLSGGVDARMQHSIQLISQEFYNDRHNTVMQGFPNIPGTAAAAAIHGQYIQQEGGLRILVPSTGLIGSQDVPHQARNVKPVKAIHDILDRCVFAQYRTCAPVYFKDAHGYVMTPLQHIVENGSINGNFIQPLAGGNSLQNTMLGYDNVLHFRPLAPPGEANSDVSSMVMGIANAAQFLNMGTGNSQKLPSQATKLLNSGIFNNVPNLKKRVLEMLAEASRGNFGARNMMKIVDELQQSLSTMKDGPGGYQQAQEAFITALTYSQKFWVSVPLQSGAFVTCGSRINVLHPFVGNGTERLVNKTLFVPRLIHEIKFTDGPQRTKLVVNGTTDIYGVLW